MKNGKRQLADISNELYGLGAMITVLSNNVIAKPSADRDAPSQETIKAAFVSLGFILDNLSDEVAELAEA